MMLSLSTAANICSPSMFPGLRARWQSTDLQPFASLEPIACWCSVDLPVWAEDHILQLSRPSGGKQREMVHKCRMCIHPRFGHITVETCGNIHVTGLQRH
jgi:hypothetical protein